MSNLTSNQSAYLEWRQRDDPHQDQPWALYLVAGGNDAWHLLNAPARLQLRGAAHEPPASLVTEMREWLRVLLQGDELTMRGEVTLKRTIARADEYLSDTPTKSEAWPCPLGHVQDHPFCKHCADISQSRASAETSGEQS